MKDQDKVYKDYSSVYDLLVDHVRCYRELRDAHLEGLLQLSPEGRILDFGCGTGNVTIPLLQSGRKVFAVDANDDMLNHLRLKSEGFDGLTLSNQDILNLSDRASKNGFSAITMMNVLYHLENPEKYLKKFHDLLSYGGKIFVSGPAKGINVDSLYEKVKEDLAEGVFERYAGEFDLIYQANKKLVGSAVLYDRESLEGLFEKGGFALESYDDSFYYGNNYFAVFRK